MKEEAVQRRCTSVRIDQTGGVEVLRVEEIELARPALQSDQELIKVTLAGVNFIDIYHRRGQYQMPLPTSLGIEGIGEDQQGRRVFWLNALGSYAQAINAPKSALTALPETNLSSEEILPLLCQGMTAHYLVDSAHRPASGDFALVTAAAGGVGLILIQLLVARKVRVIACASTPERAALARQHGAEFAGTYSEMEELVNSATGGLGVHVVYDSVGKDYFDQLLSLLAPSGMFILYGGASGPVPLFDLMRLNGKSLGIKRPTLATYTATAQERSRRLQELIALVELGALKYPPTKVFSLLQVQDAHRLIESRTHSGKIGLDPWKI
ncbi:MAG: quinone oxidoreductase [Actinobacteria bacterium]|nr:quinone oxidoreductase [Actinomycetota bacterium]